MVEMKVRENDVGDFRWRDTKQFERADEVVGRRVDVIDRCEFWLPFAAVPGVDRTTRLIPFNNNARAAMAMRFRRSGGLDFSQSTLGTTPNMAPPSNPKLPVSIACSE